MAEEVRQLVRRVVGRVLAQRGMSGGGPRLGLGGVHVTESAGAARPDASRSPERKRGGAILIDVDILASVEDGGRLIVPHGARTTPLAREEARRRGIHLDEGGLASTGRQLVVAVGCDHGGYSRKLEVKDWLRELGHLSLDLGTRDENAVDYPDFACAVAQAVAEGRADLGVVVDGAGIGSAMAANKVPGARAACCWNEASARNAREHNFANVLTLGGKMLDAATSERVLRAFIATPEGATRHERRVEKIAEIERRYTGRRTAVRRVRQATEGDAR